MVGIALLTLVPGELGGSESSTMELLREFARSSELDLRVYVPPVAPDAGQGLPTEVVREYRAARTLRERLRAMAQAALRPGPLCVRLAKEQVVHYPLTIRIPPVRLPSVVTLHDVQHLDLPHLFSRGERLFRALAYHRSARSATLVVVPSDFVRDRALARLGLDPSRVRTIHHGIDHARFTPTDEPREPFLLYPAKRWAHKNHDRLFEAFRLIRARHPELRLVLTGGGHDPASAPDGVEILGYVDEEALVSLYRRATAVVFPSLYEGFGQPPLEAMACGCPVAASNAAALPEVCGDAARLFDPSSAEAIAAAVDDVLADPGAWSARGLAHARGFTWAAAARRYEQCYRDAASAL